MTVLLFARHGSKMCEVVTLGVVEFLGRLLVGELASFGLEFTPGPRSEHLRKER